MFPKTFQFVLILIVAGAQSIDAQISDLPTVRALIEKQAWDEAEKEIGRTGNGCDGMRECRALRSTINEHKASRAFQKGDHAGAARLYQLADEDRFEYIDEAIRRGDYAVAQKELTAAGALRPGNSTVRYLQTRLWIEQGERAYLGRDFSSALSLYTEAHREWPTHPTVRDRYLELRAMRNLSAPQPPGDRSASHPMQPLVTAPKSLANLEGKAVQIFVRTSGGDRLIMSLGSENRELIPTTTQNAPGPKSEVVSKSSDLTLLLYAVIGIGLLLNLQIFVLIRKARFR